MLKERKHRAYPQALIKRLLKRRSLGEEDLSASVLATIGYQRRQFIFYLLFTVYALITVLGITDRQLLLQEPVPMPFIKVRLGLLPFFSVVPLFLLALHFNVLYSHQGYGRLLLDLRRQSPTVFKGKPLGLFESAVLFPELRQAKFIRFVLLLCFYVLPVVTLVVLYLRFSDYQNWLVTSWHLVAVGIDCVIGWCFSIFPAREPARKMRRLRAAGRAVAMALLLSMATYHVSFFLPIAVDDSGRRWLVKNPQSLAVIPEWLLPRIKVRGEVLVDPQPEIRELLKSADLMANKGVSEGGSEAKGEKRQGKEIAGIHYLPRRNFEHRCLNLADLQDCTLPRVNLTAAHLQGAYLAGASLQEADLSNANLQRAKLTAANLQRAKLTKANLQLAVLAGAVLQGAVLAGAKLQDADFSGAKFQAPFLLPANLQEAFLTAAKLQRADLTKVNIQCTVLNKAIFQGAVLSGAMLQGADLSQAKLQGTFLIQAKLQGALLRWAELQGADLSDANLQGADLTRVMLQGADLKGAELQGVRSSPNRRGPFAVCGVGRSADLSGLDDTRLTAEEAEELIREAVDIALRYDLPIPPTIADIGYAVGENSLEWAEEHLNAYQTGILTLEMAQQINRQVTDPEARKRMGLPEDPDEPLLSPHLEPAGDQ